MSQAFRHHIEEIITLTDAEFDHVLSFFKIKKLKKHQYIVQAGDLVTLDYFVLSGLVKSSFINEQGKVHILQFAMENWWVSDYKALNSQTPSAFDIDCIEDTELLTITIQNKNKLCAESHKMEHFFRIKATGGYVALQHRILSLLSNDAETRYKQLFAQYPSLFQRIPKAMIASYLGVSRETLSRLSPF
ncbi:CRP-like cAMP-binding protein [Mucilaginibacter sp. UYNi724]